MTEVGTTYSAIHDMESTRGLCLCAQLDTLLYVYDGLWLFIPPIIVVYGRYLPNQFNDFNGGFTATITIAWEHHCAQIVAVGIA